MYLVHLSNAHGRHAHTLCALVAGAAAVSATPSSSSSSSSLLILSSLELSDTHVYEPLIRALLGTASHFAKVLVLIMKFCFAGGGSCVLVIIIIGGGECAGAL